MKKFLAILLAMVLVFSLAACGGGGSDATDAEGPYTPGTYEGSAEGNNGELVLDVEVDDEGNISAVTIKESAESEEVGEPALEELTAAVVEENGTDGVDAVSGATGTSGAFFEAVNAALDEAK